MDFKKVEISFLLILGFISVILFKKVSLANFEPNINYYLVTFIVVYFIWISINIWFLKFKFFSGLFYFLLTGILMFSSSFIFSGYLLKNSLQLTKGETLWFSLFLFGLFLVLVTETIGVRIGIKR